MPYRVIAACTLAACALSVRPEAADDALVVTHRARAMHAGEVLVIAARAPESVAGVSATWHDRAVSFTRAEGAWEALLGLDVEEVPGPRTLRVVARTAEGREIVTEHPFTIADKQWRTRRLTVARRFVTPPASALPRIREESALLNAAFRMHTPEPFWTAGFVRPVDGVAVSGFGVRSILNGQPRGPHNGADFAATTGTPIHAPAAGAVVFAREFYYSGNTVIVDHGHGLFSTMAHLSAFDVEEGARVTEGQVLGKVGATGRVTGPHLHWSVRLNGARVDPLSLVDALPAPEK